MDELHRQGQEAFEAQIGSREQVSEDLREELVMTLYEITEKHNRRAQRSSNHKRSIEKTEPDNWEPVRCRS
ncbi:MAG: hypothetical protein ACLVBP_16385 [Ruminococcus sp.]